MSSVFPDGAYRDAVLERGRPTESCECDDCECELHAFPDADRCIWCRHGVHGEESMGDRPDPVPVGEVVEDVAEPDGETSCFECGDDVDPDDAKRASPDDRDGDVLLHPDCFDSILSALMDGDDSPSFLGGVDDEE